MRLPYAEEAIVERQKIAAYLLSATHIRGRGKASFFRSFGFSAEKPDDLRRALILHAGANDVLSLYKTEHGTKYTIQGPMPAPDGRAPAIISVWIVDTPVDIDPDSSQLFPVRGEINDQGTRHRCSQPQYP